MDIRGFDLNLLLAFKALAYTRSVSQAARRLGIGQPAMSAALAQLRMTLAEGVGFDPTSAHRTFTLASTDYTTALIVPTLAAWLKDHGPHIDLRFSSYDKQDVPELVARGEVDLAIGVFEPLSPDAVRTQLWTERFVGVARKVHRVLLDLIYPESERIPEDGLQLL